MVQKSARRLLQEQREQKKIEEAARARAEQAARQGAAQTKADGKRVRVPSPKKKGAGGTSSTEVGKAVKLAQEAMAKSKASKKDSPKPPSPARSNMSKDSGALILNRKKQKKTSEPVGEPSTSKPSEAGSKKRAAAGELKETAPKKARGDAPSGSQNDPVQIRFLQRAEAAKFLAKSTPAVRLPPPDMLLESELYAEAASNLFSFTESFNRIVERYDVRARSDRFALDELQKSVDTLKGLDEASRKAHATELKRVEEKAAKLEGELAKQRAETVKHKENAARMAGINLNFEDKKKVLEAKINELEEKVRTMDAGYLAEVRKVKCRVNRRYADLLESARTELKRLEEVHERAVRIAQAEGNVELITDMRGDNPPDLNVELADLQELIASDPEPAQEASALLANVIGQLVAFPDPVEPSEVHLRDETVTRSDRLCLGIIDQWGTNRESLIFQSGVEPVAIVEPTLDGANLESTSQAPVDPAEVNELPPRTEGLVEKAPSDILEASTRALEASEKAAVEVLDAPDKVDEPSLRSEDAAEKIVPGVQESSSQTPL